MLFIYENKRYSGETAVEILRAVERDSAEYQNKNGTVQDFLIWSMEKMSDQIPSRELDVSPKLSDETLAFNYLCLLDSYKIAVFNNNDSLSISSGQRKYG
jgi:hypothetical protein